ncbi:MAG TPA: hypothetical protein VH092_21200 [Urbifossiella sp.]|jgi:hypothetical protein|nr:hypothetical protein [Urbifossiella sp.]
MPRKRSTYAAEFKLQAVRMSAAAVPGLCTTAPPDPPPVDAGAPRPAGPGDT